MLEGRILVLEALNNGELKNAGRYLIGYLHVIIGGLANLFSLVIGALTSGKWSVATSLPFCSTVLKCSL
jgi:hypothetical protein